MAPSSPRAAVSATPAAPRRSPTASAPRNAFLLHRYDWSESSLILDVFTREQGRVVLVAKGAKRPYSQLRVVLLPFQRLHLVYGSRRAEAEGAEVLPLKAPNGPAARWRPAGRP
jgi:DNA repair protein RecO (recombination protein O)